MIDVHTWGFIGGLLTGVIIGLLVSFVALQLIRSEQKND